MLHAAIQVLARDDILVSARADARGGGRIRHRASARSRASLTGLLPPPRRIVVSTAKLGAGPQGPRREELCAAADDLPDAGRRHEPAPDDRQIIGRPLQFYFGIRGARRRCASGSLLDQIELNRASSSTATPRSSPAARSSASASLARLPRTRS